MKNDRYDENGVNKTVNKVIKVGLELLGLIVLLLIFLVLIAALAFKNMGA